jgi:spore coat protein U-like protein
MMMATNAWGGCSLSAPSPIANFGNTSSFAAVESAQQTSAQPGAGVRCAGSLVGLIVTGDAVNATLSSANGGEMVSPGGDRIGYDIFADAARQEQLQLGTAYNYYNSYLLGLLGILGGTAAHMPMYFRTRPSTAGNIAAGTYSDTLTISWNWSVCSGIGVLGICLGRDTGNGISVITLTLEVTPDCAINAPDLDFGSAPLVSGFSSTTRTVTIRCTKGENYDVGLSDGSHAQGGQRRMQAGSSYLAYELYKGASGTERWGRQGVERRASSEAEISPGVADGINEQGFILRGVIDPSQPTPPAGIYTDMIVVDVEF